MARQIALSCRIVIVCLVALAVLAVRPVGATVLLRVPFEAQAQSAGRIFVGEVRSVESRPRPERPAFFETLVTFAVEESVAGDVPASVVVRLSGGQVGDIRQSIDGMPAFRPGERYVVFLQPDQDPPLISPIVGFNQGLYRVMTDGRGEDIVRDRRGAPLGSAAASARTAESLEEPRLSDFVAAVEGARR